MELIVLIAILFIFVYLMKSCVKESFYDWKTLGVDPGGKGVCEYPGPININVDTVGRDCRTPHYRQDHSMFINTDNVGCGSCIYNKLDPNFDGVLPDWQWTLQNFGNTIFKSPPLDSEIYRVPEGCENCNSCN